MMHVFSNVLCRRCGDDIDLRRVNIGYNLCLVCGDVEARKRKHTIAPIHKSNYVLITDTELLKGINNKQMK
jgi:ribosomal protein L37E